MNAGVHGLWMTGALLFSLVAGPAVADEAAELAANRVSVEVPHNMASPEGGLMCPVGQTASRFYFNDFESGDGGWAVTSPANLWERGAVTTGVYQTCDTSPSPEPAGAFSGTNVWATNLDGCYANLSPSQATILAQTFDFSTLSAPIMLDWQHWYHVFEAFDRAEVIVNGTVLWRTPDANPTAGYVYQAVDLSAYAGNPNVTIQFSLFSTTVVNRMGWYLDDVGISVCAEPVELYINEVVYNPPGTDAPNEYIEIRGTPGATIPTGTYLVEIEGDGVPQAGTVDRVFDLGGRTLGANGYLVFLQQNNTYVVDPQSAVATATGAGWTGLGGANDIENGTVSLLLITAAAAPVISTDVDANNDGTLDGVGATWTILDSVGGTDGGGTDLVYGAQPCGATGFTPGSFHRIGESTGSGNADWVCSVPAGTAPNFTLSATNTLPASFAGRALDHIGSFNFPTASISLVKTVGTDPGVCAATTAIGVNAGTTVYYCYTVTNTGNITLNLHDLTDDQLGAIFSGLNFALTPGSSIDTVTAGLSIPSVINTTTTNTATWTAYNAGPVNQATAQASATVTVLSADLAMALTDSPDPVTAGSQLSYTATVSNGGPAIAQDVSFALPLPAGTSYVSATPSAGGTCTNVSPVTCTWAGATAPMADRSATIVVLVAANVANGSNLSATATASSATTDPNAANDTATTMTAVQTQADIAITAFTDSPDPVSAGTNLSYQVAMVNNGPSDAQNARFSLSLPTGTSFVSAAPSAGGSCTNTSPVTCTWAGATAPTTSRSATIVVLVAPSVLQGTTLNAVVTGTSDSTDPVAGNNSLATSTLVNAVADLQIGLTASAAQSELGQTVTFTATSTNGGPSDAQNVVLSITLSPDFRYGSHTASAGAVCTTPQIGNSGVISCTWAGPTIPGAVRTLAVNAASFVAGTSSIQAATSSNTTDPVPQSNNVASTSVLVGNPVEAIPTLSQWGLVLLSLLVGLIGVALVRRD